jgi:hypothetical protein
VGAPAITVGEDGLGVISFSSSKAPAGLKVAHCANVACSEATVIGVDGSVTPTASSSATIGVDGLPLISYGENALKVAHCSNLFCVPYARRR